MKRHDPARSCHRILIVDDDEVTAKTLALILFANGFETEFVLEGAEAIESALDDPPAAIILDLHLRDEDVPAFVVLRGLRAKYPQLPIITVTGWYLGDEHEAQTRALGATDYLFKPVTESMIVAALDAALSATTGQTSERPGLSPAAADHTVSGKPGPYLIGASHDCAEPDIAGCESTFINSRLPHLVQTIRRAFPKVWDDVIVEEVEDTLLEFLGKVKRGIWPARRSLNGHLHQAAWRNVRDHLQADGRRRANEDRYARDETRRVQTERGTLELEAILSVARTDPETEALRRWIEGEDLDRIAEALGFSQLTAAEQARELKRFKDRIKKRAQRRAAE